MRLEIHPQETDYPAIEEAEASVVALIPAHDEEELIARAVASLKNQSRVPDRIVVIADNCTDRTPEIALEEGAEVFFTSGNTQKKAGALNQALAKVLPSLGEADFVLVMDGDSELGERFVEVALARMAEDDRIGAVGGIFLAARRSSLVERLQHAEYVRYAREIARGGAKAKVITGTGALFRAEALREVASARAEGRIPGGIRQVYDTLALTEDNELTLALKSLGWRCVSPRECTVMTDVMPSWSRLWRQRVRWQRGAFENLRAYGITPTTLPYILRQAFMGVGTLAVFLLVLVTALSIAVGEVSFRPFWVGLAGIFLLERIVTVWRAGYVEVAIASVLVIEFAYDLFQQVIYVKCLWDMLFRKPESWGTHLFEEDPI
ncbi:glycosyltransferase family 2 protein [Rubrobacter calidifluminis]|uniref:glycosyltransferase family 2 protein n=1 Tax=Rubrobacter calidifluminis TaxID=1392640 RepID=UPI00235FAD3C|nr:glycosyltransferase family 2 protein [Rubrobacter calidifluminis]